MEDNDDLYCWTVNGSFEAAKIENAASETVCVVWLRGLNVIELIKLHTSVRKTKYITPN